MSRGALADERPANSAGIIVPEGLGCRIPFEVGEIALDAAEHHSAEFAKETLTSRVPVLMEDGLSLSESSALVEYLEEAYSTPAYSRVLPDG